MSSACTHMYVVSVSQMEALTGELRQLQSGMADMQTRLESLLSELAAQWHPAMQRAEAATPGEPELTMPLPTAPQEGADIAPGQAAAAAAPQAEADSGVDAALLAAAPSICDAAETPVSDPAAEPVARLPVVYADQFNWIGSIDETAAAILHSRGIKTFAGIAAMTARDVREIGELMGDMQRISKQGWIEQAALLAHGIDTAYARKVTGTHDPARSMAIDWSHAPPATSTQIPSAAELASLWGSEAMAADAKAIAEPTPQPPAPAETVARTAETTAHASAPRVAHALPDNVVVLATRRRPTAPKSRPIVARAARLAATIVLMAMAAGLTATQAGLASGFGPSSVELPAADTDCADMVPICSIAPGIPW
jgi:predicted flap endonuclease-1-like 5' DNA nuclease